jgi:hypothetical protein
MTPCFQSSWSPQKGQGRGPRHRRRLHSSTRCGRTGRRPHLPPAHRPPASPPGRGVAGVRWANTCRSSLLAAYSIGPPRPAGALSPLAATLPTPHCERPHGEPRVCPPRGTALSDPTMKPKPKHDEATRQRALKILEEGKNSTQVAEELACRRAQCAAGATRPVRPARPPARTPRAGRSGSARAPRPRTESRYRPSLRSATCSPPIGCERRRTPRSFAILSDKSGVLEQAAERAAEQEVRLAQAHAEQLVEVVCAFLDALGVPFTDRGPAGRLLAGLLRQAGEGGAAGALARPRRAGPPGAARGSRGRDSRAGGDRGPRPGATPRAAPPGRAPEAGHRRMLDRATCVRGRHRRGGRGGVLGGGGPGRPHRRVCGP